MARTAQNIEELSPLKRAFLALEKTQRRLEELERSRSEGIAVLGFGCRFPGGVAGPQDYWDLLRAGRDAITQVPRSRWDIDALYDPDPAAPGKVSSRFGGFLDNIDQFDAEFFGISPREAESMDPQQRMLLEVTQEALEHAGLATDRLIDSQTGVFVGVANADYYCVVTRSSFERIDAYLGTGTSPNAAAGRISYVFGLRGPCTALDTACSSSLVAIHLACQSLRNGECDMALAGGANVMLAPDLSITFSKARMLSPDGRCKTFDASADGYVRGEGIGVIVLKRLSDALAAGDTILAVLRGSAVNQDGPSGGLTVPNGPSQQEVIRRALAVGRISPEQIDYVEAHGTGTALGDPIEMGALGAVFAQRTRPLLVGSVKTNVGHLEGAAGIAGVIKVILAMQHEELPPHLHLKRPSPRIPWHDIPIRVVTERTPWARGARPRLAGVSSFGFSGINAHVVLEEPPAVAASDKPRRACHLLTLSAKHPAALEQLAGRFAACTEFERLEDVCLTAAAGRSHRERRLAVVADDAADARRLLGHFARGQREPGVFASDRSVTPVKVAFLFGGDGSQHVGMGRTLFHDEPAFRAAFEQCEECFRPFGDRPLREIVYPAAADGVLMNDAACAQAAIFSLEFALAALWQSWGIRPAALVGHGLGEYAAACVAGVFSLPDAVKLVAARGRLARAMTPRGRMVAVLTSLSEVQDALAGCEETVSVAAINAPRHVVIAGLNTSVDAVVEKLRAAGVATRDLQVPHAFHSPIVDPMLEELRHVANAIAYHPPQRKLVAARTGRLAGRDVARPEYWCDQVRHPVRFSDSVAQLRELEVNAFVELSPQSVLLPLARTCWESEPQAGTARWIGSLCEGRSDERALLDGLAELYAAGQAVDWQRFALPFAGRKCAAPTYPFQRHRYWIEPVATDKVPVAMPVADAVHPLLGRRVHSAAMPDIVQFEAVLGDRQPAFLADHQIAGTSVFPATAFMEIALAAGLQARPEPQVVVVLEELVLKKSMQFSRQQTRVVQAAIKPAASHLLFELHSRAGDLEVDAAPQWTLHATGRLLTRAADEMPGTADLASTRQRCTETTELGGFYERLREFGLEYGPCFRGLRRLWRGSREVLGQVVIERTEPSYLLYPPALDAALHVTVELINPRAEDAGTSGATFVPVGVDRLVLFKQMGREVWSHARLRQESEQEGANQYLMDIDLMEPDGTLVARLEGLRAQRVDFALLLPDGPDARRRATGQPAGTKAPPRDVASLLNGLSPGEQQEQVAMFVEEEVVALLKLAGHDRPARDKNLFEMGLDSLMAVDFLYRVNRGLRINLPMQSLLENATIDALTRRLVEQLQLGGTVAVAAASASVGSASESAREPATAPTNAWLPNHRVLPGAQVRLFCFPPLGESIEMFTGWEDPLRPDVEVCALQLPGSGSRRDEPPIRQWEPLVETVAEQLLDYLDRPFAFFGQGSGGLVAFDTAHFVQSRFGLAPVHLLLASCPVPSADRRSPTGDGPAASGPDQTSEPYHVALRPPLDCPITVLAEEGETSPGREPLHDWSKHTTGGFQSVCLPDPVKHPAARDRTLEIVARELEKHFMK